MILGFPVGAVVKNLPVSAGDTRDVGSVSGSGRSPVRGNGSPPQYSCNPLPVMVISVGQKLNLFYNVNLI